MNRLRAPKRTEPRTSVRANIRGRRSTQKPVLLDALWRPGWVLTVLTGLLAVSAPAAGQGIAPGQTAFDNLIPTTARSPGGMVNAGIGRALGAVRVFETIQITETEPILSSMDQFRLGALGILIEEIDEFFVFLIQRVFARAGVDVDPNAATLSTPFGDLGLASILGLFDPTPEGKRVSKRTAESAKPIRAR